jgi:hypothetical protein
MKNEKITGEEVLASIREKRKLFHSKAHFPNAILINPKYYSVLKDELKPEDPELPKEILDLMIFETNDIPSFKLIRTYDHDKCSV